MSNLKQLSIFDPIEPEFSSRIRRVEHEGETMYSLVDIVAQFSDSENEARKYWVDTKKRLKKDGFLVSDAIGHLPLPDKRGRPQKTDCATAETCLRIVQSIPSPKAEPIRQWLAHLAHERLEEARTPGLAMQNARRRELANLQRAGYSEHDAVKRLELRVEGIDAFKSLMHTITQVCDNPNYGEIVNEEYIAALGKSAKELRKILNTKSIRDNLPNLQLGLLKTAEEMLALLLSRYASMTNDQVIHAVKIVVNPLGEHFRMVCNMAGVDVVTGRPLLVQ